MSITIKKLRSDSAWAKLNPEQNARLAGWLFDEKLSYEKILKLALSEFGVSASMGSLSRYCGQLARERRHERLLDAAKWMENTPDVLEDEDRLAKGLKHMLGLTAYQLMLESPEKLPMKELSLVLGAFNQLRKQEVAEMYQTASFVKDGVWLKRQAVTMPVPMTRERRQQMIAEIREDFFGEKPTTPKKPA